MHACCSRLRPPHPLQLGSLEEPAPYGVCQRPRDALIENCLRHACSCTRRSLLEAKSLACALQMQHWFARKLKHAPDAVGAIAPAKRAPDAGRRRQHMEPLAVRVGAGLRIRQDGCCAILQCELHLPNAPAHSKSNAWCAAEPACSSSVHLLMQQPASTHPCKRAKTPRHLCRKGDSRLAACSLADSTRLPWGCCSSHSATSCAVA